MTVDANNSSRIFEINAGAAATISYLTITHGKAASGGGVYNAGTLTLDHTQVTSNTTTGSGGAGLYNTATGTATIIDSTLAHNIASSGGYGGAAYNIGSLTIRGSTLWDNTAYTGGGVYDNPSTGSVVTLALSNSTLSGNKGTYYAGGVYLRGLATFDSVTITGNDATPGWSGYYGGGLFVYGTATLRNTIVAGNTRTNGTVADDICLYSGVVDTANSQYNLIGDANTAGGLVSGTNHNLVGVDPLLGPLQDNGGPTFTHVLLPLSPAIDAGSNALLPGGLTTDQRDTGYSRIVDSRGAGAVVDIGAYEYQSSSSPPADGLIVTTLADENDGALGLGAGDSLREVMAAANAHPGADTITFDPALFPAEPTQVITLGSKDLPPMLGDVTILGPGSDRLQVTMATGKKARLLEVAPGVTARVQDLTLSGGDATADGGLAASLDGGGVRNLGALTLLNVAVTGCKAASGGGVYNAGTLTLDHTQVTSNTTTGSGGAGLYNTATGTATIIDSTLAHNIASSGGYGGAAYNIGSLTIRGSTLWDNTAYTGGGVYDNPSTGSVVTLALSNSTLSGNKGTYYAGGVYLRGLATFDSVTITGNDATPGWSGYYGGGLFVYGTATLRNTIVAGNTRTNGTVADDICLYLGTINTSTSQYNLIGNAATAGGLVNGVNHNIVGINGSGTLAISNILDTTLRDNGGPTLTHSLVSSSPARDAGDTTLTTDQRGYYRPYGIADDIGAVEQDSSPQQNQPPTLSDVPASATINELQLYTFTATATDPDLPPQTLTFSLVGAPAGASIGATSGLFTWTPTEAQGPGSYSFSVRVSDGQANTDAPITLNVLEVNSAPVLAGVPVSATIPEKQPYSFTATATDSDLPAQTLTFSLIGAPEGAGIGSSSGVFTWTPTEVQGPGSYTFTVRVSDGQANTDAPITLNVQEVDSAPMLAGVPVSATIPEMQSYSFTAMAIDSDVPAQTLTFSLIGAPEGAGIDPASGQFTWTPTEAQGPASYSFTVRVSDGIANTDAPITLIVQESNPEGQLPNTWVQVAPLPIARWELAATAGKDGTIYAIGGYTSGGVRTGEVDAYNPDTNSWTPLFPLPTARNVLAAATDSNGIIYAIGGLSSSGYTNEVDAFNPQNPEAGWTRVADLPSAGGWLSAATGSNGHIYAIGGFNTGVMSEVDEYDPTTNTWTVIASLPTPDHGLAATTDFSGITYAISGADVAGSAHIRSEVDAYSTTTDTWTPVADIPTARSNLAAATGPDGSIYAIGGYLVSGAGTSEVDAYDPTTNTWVTVASLPAPRDYLAAATGRDGRVYAIGGLINGSITSEVDAYLPGSTQAVSPTLSWTPTGSLTYGDPLTTSQLDATASINGEPVAGCSFIYSEGSNQIAVGDILSAGIHHLTATLTTSDPDVVSGGVVQADIVVAQALLTVTAVDSTKVYGDANPAFQVTYTGFVLGEGVSVLSCTLSFSTTASASSNVGVYTVTPEGWTSSNYAIAYADANLTIDPRPITVTAGAVARIYGDADPALTYQITSGSLVAGDSFSGALTRAAGENVGAYAIAQSTLALSPNYTLTYVGANFTIDPRPITVTAGAVARIYGDADPALTYQITSGSLVAGDSFSGALTRAAGENVGAYAIAQSTLALSPNYTLTYVGANFTIDPRPITVTAGAVARIYGDADPALTYQITSGSLVAGDSFSGALTRAAGENVGAYAIAQSTLALSPNYTLTYVGANFTIDPRPITVTANDATKTYGAADPTLTYRITVGSLAFSDAFTGALTRDPGENVGAYAITQGTLALSSNYTLSYVPGTLTITLGVPGCIYVLDAHASGALTVSGNASINVPGNIVVDSDSSSAITASGNAAVIAPAINVVGGVKKSGNASLNPTPAHVSSVSDPLAGLAAPNATVLGLTSKGSVSLSGNSTQIINPGVYSQIKVSGNARLSLNPGIYIIAGGGVAVSGNASVSILSTTDSHYQSDPVTDGGVLIYNAGSSYSSTSTGVTDGGNFGGITLSGNGTFSLRRSRLRHLLRGPGLPVPLEHPGFIHQRQRRGGGQRCYLRSDSAAVREL